MLDTNTTIAFIQCYGAFIIMNRFQSEQYDSYYDRRREARDRLDVDRPQWYVDAKNKFDNEKDYETKKRYERELQDKVIKYLDETVS